jgi:hypothetical protein
MKAEKSNKKPKVEKSGRTLYSNTTFSAYEEYLPYF